MDYIIVAVVAAIIFVLAILSTIGKQKRQIQDLKKKVGLLEKHIGVGEQIYGEEKICLNKDTTSNNNDLIDVDTEIRELVRKGKKIEAIKRYRILTKVGLKEAKDYIDSLDIYS
ncbi:ribosomal protein L7/L12 [Clostridium acetobutylicum]|uniref:Predicted secreted nucleic acid binding protein n=1 Tax=Clostridium acetobutylicum (strain ATCC 824 / DSM 792 / JCM 1419 / IAM 19013 / LMG 5710 / NBRC 13948 / NRRL B-527 / VKM B-1787 / 2291 / W) TaxID=272562 RepID=Q97II0_CLOAB|nr:MULTISPECIES: 50S ribosomal protein L7/L12 [Clostridium]AAK79627.1 Predicted secreted nucleic acid binding protein [Clostridium acetobutylicum ATCC 824]ADZ20711.1 secreted nucleic acid binding protein [Clostridium acetobutylicum EA 2018]AEI31932.1 secreted nucleic acid binding protein [Clostridium acetobutylicum DSM 1731]AWV79936.1 DNA-binding protein [Clostridium acetobutylicum]MBC2394078.1 DNA-binding protein [Clostridium acetobutylicum]